MTGFWPIGDELKRCASFAGCTSKVFALPFPAPPFLLSGRRRRRSVVFKHPEEDTPSDGRPTVPEQPDAWANQSHVPTHTHGRSQFACLCHLSHCHRQATTGRPIDGAPSLVHHFLHPSLCLPNSKASGYLPLTLCCYPPPISATAHLAPQAFELGPPTVNPQKIKLKRPFSRTPLFLGVTLRDSGAPPCGEANLTASLGLGWHLLA